MRIAPLCLALPILLVACDDGASPGDGDADRTAAAFEQMADSIAGGGDYARAEALRHAARIVRLVGEPTPVTLTIGGEARGFVAVAEELEYPMVVCTWPGDSGVVSPDSGGVPRDSLVPPPEPPSCEQAGSTRMRTLIAWEPGALDEVVRLVAQEGSGTVEPGVPDAMAGPAHEGGSWGGDSVAPPVGGAPGFMGEYLRRDEGFWMSVAGTQANALEREGGACREATAEFDWARYACEAIRVRFEFAMQVQKMVMVPFDGWSPPDSMPSMPPIETLDIAMPATVIAGARLSLLEWLPPTEPWPGPGPDPMPVPGDSAGGMPGMPGGG